MPEQPEALFTAALGLSSPWYVEDVDLDAAKRELHMSVAYRRGWFRCPACDVEGATVHDTTEKTWRHLNFFQHEAYIHAKVPRVTCSACGKVTQVSVPWARPGSHFTLLFEALVMSLAPEMPVRALARLVNEHDTRLWRIPHHYVEEARARADFSEVTSVGVDETAAKRGQNYIIMKMANESVDEVRRQEVKISKTGRAYRVRLSLAEFFNQPSREVAEAHLKLWYFWATHRRLAPVVHLAQTIRAHWACLLNRHDSHISTGILEGMTA